MRKGRVDHHWLVTTDCFANAILPSHKEAIRVRQRKGRLICKKTRQFLIIDLAPRRYRRRPDVSVLPNSKDLARARQIAASISLRGSLSGSVAGPFFAFPDEAIRDTALELARQKQQR
jgi:hypothetical protein